MAASGEHSSELNWRQFATASRWFARINPLGARLSALSAARHGGGPAVVIGAHFNNNNDKPRRVTSPPEGSCARRRPLVGQAAVCLTGAQLYLSLAPDWMLAQTNCGLVQHARSAASGKPRPARANSASSCARTRLCLRRSGGRPIERRRSPGPRRPPVKVKLGSFVCETFWRLQIGRQIWRQRQLEQTLASCPPTR